MSSDLKILYLDDDIIVADKPYGLLSIPDGYNPNLPNLFQLLQTSFENIYIVHRLDKDTSGVIVFARNSSAHRSLNLQFQNRAAQKIYLAWVTGTPEWSSQAIELPLRVNSDRKHRTLPDRANGKSALTLIKVIENNGFASLVAAFPRTGYTHQIRSHLAAVQHPILFDSLYNPEYKPLPGKKAEKPKRRLMLHAFGLQFIHPASNEQILIFCQPPGDFLVPTVSMNEIQTLLG